ncbi:hypothetical protein ARMGADRAFT_1092866 [Armillaria gallica]|uniref:Uncharacterized protein n=1 Tax=Armillaria gallica TaxID=47427 RepID=A0A2H3C9D8_ARMGA|nr:hypothetical protein ARMGADRAFT_1092866 [Armillaria gallica]
MASLMGESPEDYVIEWREDLARRPTFLDILQFIHNEHVADIPCLLPIEIIADPPQCVVSMIDIVGLLLGQAFKWGIPRAYEAFQEKDSLRYLTDNISLHPELIKLLCIYITGVSKAVTLPNIQSDGFLHWHIQDLHQATVICCICASITPSNTERGHILSSVVSINPHHSEWDGILEILKSPADKNSIIKETVGMLDKFLNVKRNL